MYPGAHARRTPDKVAVVVAESGGTRTYAELNANSAQLARVLHEQGLRRGDVVALLSENSEECFEAYWAALRSGLYLSPINHQLSLEEIAFILNDSGARALIVSATLASLAASIVPLTPDVMARYIYRGVLEHHESYNAALQRPYAQLPRQPCGAEMLYSSGTTGRPKCVREPLPGGEIDDSLDLLTTLLRDWYDVGPDTVYLSPAPLYHSGPLRWSRAVHALGGTVVTMKNYDPEIVLEAIERNKVTLIQLVPIMFVKMLKLPAKVRQRFDVSSLRVAVHSAAPCPVEVKRRMIEWWGPIIYEYYASTELHGMTLIDTVRWLKKPGSVGKSVLGTVHICDGYGKELATGETGFVYFERPQVPFEYHNDPESTKSSQCPGNPNWTTVGDLGYLDDEGFLFLVDREDFVITSDGVDIYPQEIENILTMHPAVQDIAVVGIPDEDSGEQVKAVVRVENGVESGRNLELELIEYVRNRVPRHKVPRSVDFVDELPRAATGKLLKKKLKIRYALMDSARM